MLEELTQAGIKRLNDMQKQQEGQRNSPAPESYRDKDSTSTTELGTVTVESINDIAWAGEDVLFEKTTTGKLRTWVEGTQYFALKQNVTLTHQAGAAQVYYAENKMVAETGDVSLTTSGGVQKTEWIVGPTKDMIMTLPFVALKGIWEGYRTTTANAASRDIAFDDLVAEDGFGSDEKALRDFIVGYLDESHPR